ncbi:MAG: hypothetical protein NTY20_01140 [Candidatus Aenigmarchaeota archaeon]|nr:hypothetical protein [Candidatus Aenigmarchaeota archaeon]
MVKIHSERIKSSFEGTIIDIETIGNFCGYNDSRRYKEVIPVIFGFINKDGLNIHCAKNINSIDRLKEKTKQILLELKRPFYAFNSDFECGTLFHHLRKPVIFERELNKERFEGKRHVVQLLKIQNYNDPFNDNGRACMEAWLNGEINKSILHNRSCLLKERDILLKRGFRKPDELRLIK